jgi:hypothetical protein
LGSTQAFYKWGKNPLTQRDGDDAQRINAALDIHADDPAFGYRLIADELPARGIVAGDQQPVAAQRSPHLTRALAADNLPYIDDMMNNPIDHTASLHAAGQHPRPAANRQQPQPLWCA